MSVDDRDFVEEAVTTELGWFAPPPKEPPKFMAMGTVVDDEPPAFLAMGTHVDAEDVREEDLEVTQPIPKMTMAELVYAPTDVAMRRTEPAKLFLAEPLPTLPMRRAGDVVEVKARALGTIPPGDVAPPAEWIVEVEMLAAVPPTSRKIRPRRSRPRARTIAPRRLTSVELREVANTATEQADRPRTRAECAHEQRPCPWVSCKHHLYLDVNPRTGSIKLNFPDLEPWELQHTCALDVADDGGHTLEEVGDITNLTRERIRQLEMRGLLELRGRSRTLR